MKISSNVNCDEKGNVDIEKTEKADKIQEAVISSHNLIPNNRPLEPEKVLKSFEKSLKKEKKDGNQEG